MGARRSSPASPFTSATDILRQIVDTKMVTLFSVVVLIISISLVIGCKEEDTTFTILTGYVFRDPSSIITTQVNRLRLIQSKVFWRLLWWGKLEECCSLRLEKWWKWTHTGKKGHVCIGTKSSMCTWTISKQKVRENDRQRGAADKQCLQFWSPPVLTR